MNQENTNSGHKLIVKKGIVSEILLNRPEKSNALDGEMFQGLVEAFADLDKDPEVKVVILKGCGKGFSAGADLDLMSSEELNILEKRRILESLPQLLKLMSTTKNIVISQIHGYALAGGFGLALSADLTVCTQDARLGMPEIKRGLMPMNIMASVSRNLPRKKFLELMLTGEDISPQEALSLGMVTRVCAAVDLEKTTAELAEKIGAQSGYALKLGKEAFYNIQDMEYAKCFPYLNDMLMMVMMARDSESYRE